jgi:hypothetical protein
MADDTLQATPSGDDTRRVLDALDFEIAQIRTDQQTLGWTTWAAL